MSAPRSTHPLSLAVLLSLVIANMIGAGVFTTSGFALKDLGGPSWVMLAWVVGGVIAFCGACSYAALIIRIRESGGEYLFLARRFHPLAGFLAGWVSMLAGFTGAIAFAALALETYLLGAYADQLPHGVVAIAAILIGGILHGIRRRPGALSLVLLVALKIGLLLGFVSIGAFAISEKGVASEIFTGARPGLAVFATAVMWISLSFSGFNAAVYIAEESSIDRVRRAMIVGCLITTVLYLGLNAVFLFAVPGDVIVGQEDVAARVAVELGGGIVSGLVRAIICIALLTSVSSMVMAGPRVYRKMAQDGMLPAWFIRGEDVPASAVWFQIAAASVVVIFATLVELLSYLSFVLSITSALAVAGLFIGFRMRDGFERVTFWEGIAAFVYVIATLVFAALSVTVQPKALIVGMVTLATGIVLWLILSRCRIADSR